MKIINEQRTVTDVYYEATDGTRFNTSKECEIYEKTAKCAIKAAFNSLPMRIIQCDQADDNLTCDSQYGIIKPRDANDIIVINAFLKLFDSKLVPVDVIGHTLVFYINYDEEWYYEGTAESKIKKYAEALYMD